MGNKQKYIAGTISKISIISKRLKRITFDITESHFFSKDLEGASLKVYFANQLEDIKKSKSRTYTLSQFQPKDNSITIDFMTHDQGGPGSSWAKMAKMGDILYFSRPSRIKMKTFPITDYLFIGDLTSFGAINAYARKLPEGSSIRATLFLESKDEVKNLGKFSNIDIKFKNLKSKKDYVKVVKKYEALSSETILFSAGQSCRIKKLKNYLKKEKCPLKPKNVFISSYWS
ncbi:MAG: hypothetical protein CME60_11010 [Halobacteriovoraceae bacterium]|jgi:NADPH-dependent ferric siderophore reductase|nr:hypothetical protein [Halobacteriovoraceae bacterium]|tara:strand:+ start:1033 stop:1722 length:690 start_codon:yes stop_codon:yes gene_type:complete